MRALLAVVVVALAIVPLSAEPPCGKTRWILVEALYVTVHDRNTPELLSPERRDMISDTLSGRQLLDTCTILGVKEHVDGMTNVSTRFGDDGAEISYTVAEPIEAECAALDCTNVTADQ